MKTEIAVALALIAFLFYCAIARHHGCTTDTECAALCSQWQKDYSDCKRNILD